MPTVRNGGYHQIFGGITTISEAATLWGKHKNTVRSAIDDGRVAAAKVGSVWIIAIDSLVELWGKPEGYMLSRLPENSGGFDWTLDIPF